MKDSCSNKTRGPMPPFREPPARRVGSATYTYVERPLPDSSRAVTARLCTAESGPLLASGLLTRRCATCAHLLSSLLGLTSLGCCSALCWQQRSLSSVVTCISFLKSAKSVTMHSTGQCALACPCCHPMPEALPIPDYRVARTAAFLHARRCLVPVVALSFSNVDSLFIVQRTKCEDIARNRLIELARTKKSARPCLPRASVGTARVGVVHFVG